MTKAELHEVIEDLIERWQEAETEIMRLNHERVSKAAKGGYAAAAKLTPDQRSERSRKAALARWHGKTP